MIDEVIRWVVEQALAHGVWITASAVAVAFISWILNKKRLDALTDTVEALKDERTADDTNVPSPDDPAPKHGFVGLTVAKAILRAADVTTARRLFDEFAEGPDGREMQAGLLPWDAMQEVYSKAGMRDEADEIHLLRSIRFATFVDDVRAGRPLE